MTLDLVVARVAAALGRGHALFSPAPLDAAAGLSGSSQTLTSLSNRIGASPQTLGASGQFATAYGGVAKQFSGRLSGTAGLDAKLSGLVSDAAAADAAGRNQSGNVVNAVRPPTVLGDVTPAVSVYREEVFGPVAAIITVADADEAGAVANDTPFGLGASVWSADVQAAVAVGRRITSGVCFINALVVSDARMPFGGTKRSGYGRELAAPGIREFVNVRTWWALNEPQTQAPTSE